MSMGFASLIFSNLFVLFLAQVLDLVWSWAFCPHIVLDKTLPVLPLTVATILKPAFLALIQALVLDVL